MAQTKRAGTKRKNPDDPEPAAAVSGRTRASTKPTEPTEEAYKPAGTEPHNGGKRLKTNHRAGVRGASDDGDGNDSGADDEARAPTQTTTESEAQAQTRGGATTLPPVDESPDERLIRARHYLSTHNHRASDSFVQEFKSIEDFTKTVDELTVDASLSRRVRAMLRVHNVRMQRAINGGYWVARELAFPQEYKANAQEPQMFFAASNYTLTHPFPWTQRFWKFQNELGHSAVMPPPAPRHARHKPLELQGPDYKVINQAQCRDRWTLLRLLQFDLLYMTYATELSRDHGKADTWRDTPEGRMLMKLRQENLITDFSTESGSISRVTREFKLERMEPLGVDSFLFEGCDRPTTTVKITHLTAENQQKLRDMARGRVELGQKDRKAYARLRGKFLNELEYYETLKRAFTEDEAGYADRRRMAKKSKSLRQLAQSLNTPGAEVPSDEKAKALLTNTILQENSLNYTSQIIDHSQNWLFARQIDEEVRPRRFFSLNRWSGLTPRDSSSSGSSGPPRPPGAIAMSPVRELSKDARDEYEQRVGNAHLAGFSPDSGEAVDLFSRHNPNNHHIRNVSEGNSSSSGRSFVVGSGMLVPPEVLGITSSGQVSNTSDSSVAQNRGRIEIPPKLLGVDTVRGREEELLRENDARIAEVRQHRRLKRQNDDTYVRGRAFLETAPSRQSTQLTPEMMYDLGGYDRTVFPYGPPIFPFDWDIFRIESHMQEMKSPLALGAPTGLRRAPMMPTLLPPSGSAQRPPSPLKGPDMGCSQKASSAHKSKSLESPTRLDSPRKGSSESDLDSPPAGSGSSKKRPSESDDGPPPKKLYSKLNPDRFESTTQHKPPALKKLTHLPTVLRAESAQMDHPQYELKNTSLKRPALVEPPSPRKRHSPSRLPGLSTSTSRAASRPAQVSQAGNSLTELSTASSADVSIDQPRSPTIPTIRSPKRAPTPPKEPRKEKDEASDPPLSADELFALGFPDQFGTQESGSGHDGKVSEQASGHTSSMPQPVSIPNFSQRNSPQPTFGQPAWTQTTFPSAQSSFSSPSLPIQSQQSRSIQTFVPHLTPPQNVPPPHSPPPFPVAQLMAPSPPSTTRSSLPITSLDIIRVVGLPPDSADESSSDENPYPYHSKTVSAFKQALKGRTDSEGKACLPEDQTAQDDEEDAEEDKKAAAAEEDEDEEFESDFDSDEDLNVEEGVLPELIPSIQAIQRAQARTTPAWTQNQAPITGTGEAWTRAEGSGVSTRGRVSLPPENDGRIDKSAKEREDELDSAADDDDSLYPDIARAQEGAPTEGTGDESQREGGEGGSSAIEDREGGEDRSIDYLFESGDDDLVDWGGEDMKKS